jgi:hypothetical protein
MSKVQVVVKTAEAVSFDSFETRGRARERRARDAIRIAASTRGYF